MNILRTYSAPGIRVIKIAAQTILAGSDEPSTYTNGLPDNDDNLNNF